MCHSCQDMLATFRKHKGSSSRMGPYIKPLWSTGVQSKSWPNHLVHHRLWAQLGSCRPCLAGGHGTPCSHLAKQVLWRFQDFQATFGILWFTASKCFNDVTWNVRNSLEDVGRCWKQPNITSNTPLRPSCLGDNGLQLRHATTPWQLTWSHRTWTPQIWRKSCMQRICDKISSITYFMKNYKYPNTECQ